ncbi:unnamed protein product [Rotaria sp. Silwood1]|nr:unnamed protein product [Rotaria sp. Silwood1]CAF1244841.1 unnamed protein product [Rotaria sp. Silwood1]CAF3472493.1 unnamed protein product [Rotaria sp. Silwood1]CAF4723058.1 unnamed protein product [Rotaria sp. Silwood1]CAF4998915.1 unnamed protein product [Rotaria sp. Silwood1]
MEGLAGYYGVTRGPNPLSTDSKIIVSSADSSFANSQTTVYPPSSIVTYPTHINPGGLPPRSGPTLPGNISGY